MKLPIEFAIRAPSPQQIEHAKFWWNFTDKLFRLIQWVFFLSLLIYANGKVHSAALTIPILVMFFSLFKVITSMYEQYIGFNVSDHVRGKWSAATIKVVLSLFFSGISLYIGFSVIGALVGAFLQIQAAK